jgi:aminoglycoside 6-adenylyltransferase
VLDALEADRGERIDKDQCRGEDAPIAWLVRHGRAVLQVEEEVKMNPGVPTYDALIARLTRWAEAAPDVRALTVIGSRARQQDPADEWSDIDIVLVAKEPRVYLADGRWLAQFGEVWLTHVDDAPVGGVVERRAVFEGALELDLVVLSRLDLKLARWAMQLVGRLPAALHILPRSVRGGLAAVSEVFSRGIRPLVDKDGLMAPLPAALAPRQNTRPSAEQFRATNDRFWHGAIWVAKHLRRGELWRAKDGCDVRMKMSILRLAEWHAKATKGWDLDTWAEGRFLERWADPRVVAALHGAFAHYESEDVWRALFATMDLFCCLARETAAKLGLSYGSLAEERASEWVRRCFSERDAMRVSTPAKSNHPSASRRSI